MRNLWYNQYVKVVWLVPYGDKKEGDKYEKISEDHFDLAFGHFDSREHRCQNV